MAGGQPQRELRILVFADLHLDRALPWATREAGADARQGQQVTLEAICAIAAAEADALISAGDLYDYDRHHPETGELLRAAFERLAPMPVILVPGETDPLDGLSLYEHVKWTPNVHVLAGGPPASISPLEGLNVWSAGDVADLAGADVGTDTFDLAVVHGRVPDQLDELKVQHVIAAAGHYPQDGAAVTTPGAAYPVDPEDPPGGVVVLNIFEDGSLAVTRRDLGTYPAPRPPRRFPTDALAEYDLAVIGEEQTVRGEFVRNLLTPEEAPVHLRRLALLSGLRALSGLAPPAGDEAGR